MKTIICNQCGKPKEGTQTGLCLHCGRFGKTDSELNRNAIKVNEGDYFLLERPFFGVTRHKCVKVKQSTTSDISYNGWLVDENRIMYPPKDVIYNETTKEGIKKKPETKSLVQLCLDKQRANNK